MIKAVVTISALVIFSTVFLAGFMSAGEKEEKAIEKPSRLLVVWTSGDRDVALKMVFMYTFNAKKRGWFDEVALLVWGPSARLTSEDKELQEYLVKMKEAGVVLEACKACSDSYGVSAALEKLGIDVKYMGVPLTEYVKSDDWHVLTF